MSALKIRDVDSEPAPSKMAAEESLTAYQARQHSVEGFEAVVDLFPGERTTHPGLKAGQGDAGLFNDGPSLSSLMFSLCDCEPVGLFGDTLQTRFFELTLALGFRCSLLPPLPSFLASRGPRQRTARRGLEKNDGTVSTLDLFGCAESRRIGFEVAFVPVERLADSAEIGHADPGVVQSLLCRADLGV